MWLCYMLHCLILVVYMVGLLVDFSFKERGSAK